MKPFFVLGAVAVMACASAGAGGTSVDAGNPNIITGDQEEERGRESGAGVTGHRLQI